MSPMPAGLNASTESVDLLTPLMNDYLQTCLAALERDGNPVKRALLSPSPPAWDSCCDGMLWVRLVTIQPTQQAGSSILQGSCGVLGWTVTLAIGVLRCIPTVNSQGRSPKPEKITESTVEQIEDVQSIQNAVQSLGHTRSIENWMPLRPQGGCAGGEWTITARLNNCLIPLHEVSDS